MLFLALDPRRRDAGWAGTTIPHFQIAPLKPIIKLMSARKVDRLGQMSLGLIAAIGLSLAWLVATPFSPGLTAFSRGRKGPGGPVTLRCPRCKVTPTYKVCPKRTSDDWTCKNRHPPEQREEVR
jgi:hypothetical protein